MDLRARTTRPRTPRCSARGSARASRRRRIPPRPPRSTCRPPSSTPTTSPAPRRSKRRARRSARPSKPCRTTRPRSKRSSSSTTRPARSRARSRGSPRSRPSEGDAKRWVVERAVRLRAQPRQSRGGAPGRGGGAARRARAVGHRRAVALRSGELASSSARTTSAPRCRAIAALGDRCPRVAARRCSRLRGCASAPARSSSRPICIRQVLQLWPEDTFARESLLNLLRAQERWAELVVERRAEARGLPDGAPARRALPKPHGVEVRLADMASAAAVYDRVARARARRIAPHSKAPRAARRARRSARRGRRPRDARGSPTPDRRDVAVRARARARRPLRRGRGRVSRADGAQQARTSRRRRPRSACSIYRRAAPTP